MTIRLLLLLIATIVALSTDAPAQDKATAVRPPALLADEPWSPAPWADLAPAVRREAEGFGDSTSYEAARLDPAFEARRWRYASDSNTVVAFVFRPCAPGPFPAIVYCRGSYVQQGRAERFLPLFHRLARAGYWVVAPQYRGSEGGTGRDEIGGGDVTDVLEAVRHVAARPEVDARAVYLYGVSRGGMMVFQAIRDRAPVRAAATVGAFTDLDLQFASYEPSAATWPDPVVRREESAMRRRSAARWADRLQVPLLLLHGEADRAVLPAHSRRLAAALTRSGLEHELKIVPGGSHTLGERAAFRDSLIVAWFRGHAP